jgi:hypothetical protein
MDGTLNPKTAPSSTEVYLERIKFGNTPRSKNLRMLLKDRPDKHYPGGWLLDGEKSATTRVLKLPYPHRERGSSRPPIITLMLGFILGEVNLVTDTRLQEMKDCLSEWVALGSVGPISYPKVDDSDCASVSYSEPLN